MTMITFNLKESNDCCFYLPDTELKTQESDKTPLFREEAKAKFSEDKRDIL